MECLLIPLLIFVSLEDYRFRAVSWVLFPLLSLACVLYSLQSLGWPELLANGAVNLLFIGTQLALLTLYFSLKNRRFVNVTHNLLGWGDILFFLAMGFLFSPVNYCLFYVASLLVAVVVGVLGRLANRELGRSIPLAGIQAGLLVLLMSFRFVHPVLDLTHDTWFSQYLLLASR